MDNDRPPIIHIISRETGEERCWVVGHSDKATCQGILAEAVPHDATMVYMVISNGKIYNSRESLVLG